MFEKAINIYLRILFSIPNKRECSFLVLFHMVQESDNLPPMWIPIHIFLTSLNGQVYSAVKVRLGPKETHSLFREVLTSSEKSTRGLLTVFNELKREQKECSKCEETSVIGRKLVPSARNRPMHNARKVSKIRTLGERLLKVKGVSCKGKMIQG